MHSDRSRQRYAAIAKGFPGSLSDHSSIVYMERTRSLSDHSSVIYSIWQVMRTISRIAAIIAALSTGKCPASHSFRRTVVPHSGQDRFGIGLPALLQRWPSKPSRCRTRYRSILYPLLADNYSPHAMFDTKPVCG